MKYTLYDDLINKKYFITEAQKNDFPFCDKYTKRYNQWVLDEILDNYIDYYRVEFDKLFRPGVYSLTVVRNTFYIGKTSRPIILRIIDHLMDTIPTPKSKDLSFNEDKIMVTKIALLLDKKIELDILSDDPKEEESIINERCLEDEVYLTNKQFCNERITYKEFWNRYFLLKGKQCSHDDDEFYDYVDDFKEYITELRIKVKDRISLLRDRVNIDFNEIYLEGTREQ